MNTENDDKCTTPLGPFSAHSVAADDPAPPPTEPGGPPDTGIGN